MTSTRSRTTDIRPRASTSRSRTARRAASAWLRYSARPGRLAYVGPVEIVAPASVNERIVRRQLTFKSGDLFEQSRLRDSQRKLYSPRALQLRQRRSDPERDGRHERAGIRDRSHSDPRHRNGRQAPEGQFRLRLRLRGKGARRDRLAPRELPRRRPHGRRVRPLFLARSRRAPQSQAALSLQPAVCGDAQRAVVVQRRAGVQAHDDRRTGVRALGSSAGRGAPSSADARRRRHR